MEIMKTNMENCKRENLNKVEHSNVPKRRSYESFYFPILLQILKTCSWKV